MFLEKIRIYVKRIVGLMSSFITPLVLVLGWSGLFGEFRKGSVVLPSGINCRESLHIIPTNSLTDESPVPDPFWLGRLLIIDSIPLIDLEVLKWSVLLPCAIEGISPALQIINCVSIELSARLCYQGQCLASTAWLSFHFLSETVICSVSTSLG